MLHNNRKLLVETMRLISKEDEQPCCFQQRSWSKFRTKAGAGEVNWLKELIILSSFGLANL